MYNQMKYKRINEAKKLINNKYYEIVVYEN